RWGAGGPVPRRRRLATADSMSQRFAALLLLTACESVGPAPQLDAFAHALVCDLPGKSFDVHGQNLQKAHIELLRVRTVVDVPVSESPTTPPSHLVGDSLHVDLDGYAEGVYDVTAVSGPYRWTTMSGLAILPPPSIGMETSGFCNAQSAQTLTVHGSGFVVL